MVKVTVGPVESKVFGGGHVESVRLYSRQVSGATLVQTVLTGALETLFGSEALAALTGNPNARHPGSW